ncbi:MAG TPA: Gfo/Idh/MocA family oxidoreductase [Terriglobia bacterium]|nr:Gfo/Idh/MocA family oxidoreductase [Terriglobia bacterium]
MTKVAKASRARRAHPIGYAVVGLGSISQDAVLPAFRHSRNSKLVAVVSGDQRKARRLAAKFGARDAYTFDEYDLCLSRPAVQAVFIATPNGAHAPHAIRAAGAGKHVLCEKPMANTADECRRMIDAARDHGVRLMIAYRKYFDPASLALKKLVKQGKLGRLRIIHSAFTICLPPDAPPWHLDRRLAGGGSLMDVGVYTVNTVRWLTGQEPVEAEATEWTLDPARFREVEEHIAYRLKFPHGLVLQATASFGAAQAAFLHVHGERGWAALDPAFAYDEERRLFGKIGGRWFEQKFRVIDEFALELDHFSDCIRRRREPEPSGEQGLRDVAVMEAIYLAAREGHPVPIVLPA